MYSKDTHTAIWWGLFGLICVWLGYYIFTHLSYYTRPYEAERLAKIYSESQYVLGPASKGGIGDDGVYAFAGYYYVFSGGDVSSVNFEHPPLGKYLIGVSIFLFNNENVINLIYFIALLYVSYNIARCIATPIPSLLAVGFLATDPLMLDHILRSQLDLPFTLFIVCGIYFFLLSRKNPVYLYISHMFWGSAFATRFFPLYLAIWVALGLYLLKTNRDLLKTYVVSSLLVPVIYLLSHIAFFVYHPSLIEFIQHKRWMISWYRGTPIIPGNILRNLYTGYYLDSKWILVRNEYWIACIPLIYTLAVMRVRKTLLKDTKNPLWFLYMFTMAFLLYVTVLTNGLQKFIMPAFPLICVLAVSNLEAMYSMLLRFLKKKHNTAKL